MIPLISAKIILEVLFPFFCLKRVIHQVNVTKQEVVPIKPRTLIVFKLSDSRILP
mgnify:CR=1 FL=1